MEVSTCKWTPEVLQGQDYSNLLNQYQMNPLDYSLDEIDYFQDTQKRIGSNVEINLPAKQLKMSDDNINNNCSSNSCSQIISFGDVIPKREIEGSPNLGSQGSSVSTSRRNYLQAQDHVISERKRREKLSQRFIQLSALIPGLKKSDKASVLGDTIKYLKQLHERVKKLEDKTANKTMESIIVLKKSHISIDDNDYNNQSYQLRLPHVEVRVCDKDVLIRIHCENVKGASLHILTQIQKLPLNVLTTNVLPFGKSTLDITVIAQMEMEKAFTVKELVENLRLALVNYI